ncbi:hypothetical protein F2Q70_00023033 [Brassica cretica]|uniref:Uncharacterized protein n=1 Tax=Brassica cretica TaxID=69181 RepID=A0A8S9GMJ9_BRACR|nr:hypothetical protein F2Q70_00023033 [Brassica cretica]KAF3611228.1 hypothetical protein DY000_02050027 [Brassica cretica]
MDFTERPSLGNPKREAYATILHSAHVYVCGAIAAAQSIRQSGSNRDLVILVDETEVDSKPLVGKSGRYRGFETLKQRKTLTTSGTTASSDYGNSLITTKSSS